jgi:hypothetical protein
MLRSILAILAETRVFFRVWRWFALPTANPTFAVSCIGASRTRGKNGVFNSYDHDDLLSRGIARIGPYFA